MNSVVSSTFTPNSPIVVRLYSEELCLKHTAVVCYCNIERYVTATPADTELLFSDTHLGRRTEIGP